MRRLLVPVLVLALGLLVAVAPVAAQQYKLEFKNSLVVGPSGPWGEAAIKFAELLKERTQGRINVKNYFAGQLFAGKQTNEFTLLNQGVADFAFGSTINWSPQVKELNLFAMPFMYPSYKALDAVQGGEPGQRLFKIIESKGVIPLAWAENGFRQITNSKRAVRKPEDLKDLKIRVVGSPIFIDTFRALGANPVNMNWGEAQQAFQQGTVDGQENPVVSVIIPFKLWTSQKHLTAWHYAIDPVIIAVSKLTWDGLTPADREIVRKTAVEMAAWEKAGARKGLADSTAAYDELRKNGMDVVTLTPADLAAFREKTKPVYDKWVTEVGADLVKSAEAIIAKTK
ncbi:MAG: DctP family TRAP transporter solute-binding subunit [Candidatus Rokubacteria bacterium]|nr:DctP family TRAP transporter solute-binding subunit [Candidatus Rokubacteria bacterium]MBI2157867.1 DctP family TRAP transporter solute-binding subunit [Candidatus Rokubacteria bacterium]